MPGYRSPRGFDIYILDILMPGLSGIDAARKLRQLGDGGEIIYITNSNDFAADSYEVRAFSYLLKPVDEARLFKVLDGAVEKLERRRSSAVMVNTPGGMQRIRLEQILYVERMGHCMALPLRGRGRGFPKHTLALQNRGRAAAG